MNDTDLRLSVLSNFLDEHDLASFEAVLLTGSLVFGKYFSVHAESDIDIICIIDSSKIQTLAAGLFGKININKDLLNAFEKGMIDRFWLDYYFDSVKINIGIWDKQFVDAFLEGQAAWHVLGSANDAIQPIHTCDAAGKDFTYTPQIERYETIYVKTFPLRHDSHLIGSPTYNNLVASELLYDPGHMYERKIATLIKHMNDEYGDVWQNNFLQYVMRKSSPDYLRKLKKHLGSPLLAL